MFRGRNMGPRTEKGFSSILALVLVVALLLGFVTFVKVSNATALSSPYDVKTPAAAVTFSGPSNDAVYLIITRQMFENALQPLVELKENRGMSVKVVTLDEIIKSRGAKIYTSADTCIDNYYPNNNYGSSQELDVGTFVYGTRRSYLKFDLENLPSGAIIQSATLYLSLFSFSSKSGYISAYSVGNDNWLENGLTWNNRPAVGAYLSTNHDPIADSQWYSWAMDNWVENQFATDKIVSICMENDSSDSGWYSKECGSPYIVPYLEVVYTILPGGDNYPGRDIPEQIRNCIRDYYDNHGTKWVLLAGDVDPDDCTTGYILDKPWEVPIRYVQIVDTVVPTDHYYAGLNGTWDNNNDNVFDGLSEADLFADVYVGRFPARDASTMQAIVNKTVLYEADPPTMFIDVCLFAAQSDPYAEVEAKWIKNNVLPADVSTHEYYQSEGTFDNYHFNYAVNTYNPMLICAISHGNFGGIVYYENGKWKSLASVTTPSYITNKGFLMYAYSCSTNVFDINGTCFGEAMLQDPAGGAVGYVGGTVDLSNWGLELTDAFFSEIFWNGELHQGAILYKSELKDESSNPSERSDSFAINLLGDPELKIIDPPHGVHVYATPISPPPNYSVAIRNWGNFQENYHLTVNDNAKWNLVLDNSSFNNVLPDEERTTVLRVTIPENVLSGTEDNITITATSTDNAAVSDNYNFKITASRNVTVLIPPSQLGFPGDTIEQAATVINEGNVSDNYDLRVSDNAGWTIELENRTLWVPAGANLTATLIVNIPENAGFKAEDKITVTAVSHIFPSVTGNCSVVFRVGVIYASADVYATDSSNWDSPQLKFYISSIHRPIEWVRLHLFGYAAVTWAKNYVMRVDNQTWGETIENYEFDAQPVTNIEIYDNNKWHGSGWGSWDWIDVTEQFKAETDENLTLRLSNINSGWQTLVISDYWPDAHPPFDLCIGSDQSAFKFYSSENPENIPYLEVYPAPLKITTCPNSQGNLPGSTLNYTVTVKNYDNVAENYYLGARDSTGWLATETENIFPLADIYASSNQTSASQLKFDLGQPKNVTSAILHLYCYSAGTKGGSSCDFSFMRVNNQTWGENITPSEFDAQSVDTVEPAEVPSGPVGWWQKDAENQLKNNGEARYITFRLLADWFGGTVEIYNNDSLYVEATYQDPWVYFYSSEYGDYLPYLEVTYIRAISPSTLTVPPGENRMATLTVTIPENAKIGTLDDITVAATSQTDPSLSDSASCMLGCMGNTTRWPYVSISPSSQVRIHGSTLNYAVTVTNIGIGDNYVLTATDGMNWTKTFSDNLLSIPAGGNRATTLSVTIPGNAAYGAVDTITVTATSQTNGAINNNASCTARSAINSCKLSIDPRYSATKPGGNVTFTVWVMNTSDDSFFMDNYTLSASGSLGWQLSIDNIQNVLAGENGETTLTVTIPGNAVIGTKDNILVTATSRENAGVRDNGRCVTYVALLMGTASIRLATSQVNPPFLYGIYKAYVNVNLTVYTGDNLRLRFLAQDNKTIESENVIWSRTAPGAQTVNLTNLIVPHDNALVSLGSPTDYIKRMKLVLTDSAGNVLENVAWYRVVPDDWGARISWIVINWSLHTPSNQDRLGDEISTCVLNWALTPYGPRDQHDFQVP
jgi:uncharacterized membrane protein